MSRFRSPSARVRTAVAGVVAAAVAVGGMATVPAAAAAPGATTAAATSAAPAPAAAALAPPTYDVLVFSKTAGFRHDSIRAGIRAIERLGAQYGFTVDGHRGRDGVHRREPRPVRGRRLAVHDRRRAQRRAADRLRALHQGRRRLRRRPRRLRHRVHVALVRPARRRLLPAATRPAPRPRPSTSRTRPRRPPCALPDRWERTDEWYNFQSRPTRWSAAAGPTTARAHSNVNVIATLDESTYDEVDGPTRRRPPDRLVPELRRRPRLYTGGGHTQASFSEPLFRTPPARRHPVRRRRGPRRVHPRRRPPTPRFEQVDARQGRRQDRRADEHLRAARRARAAHRPRRPHLPAPTSRATRRCSTTSRLLPRRGRPAEPAVDPNFATNRWVYLYYAPPLDTPGR